MQQFLRWIHGAVMASRVPLVTMTISEVVMVPYCNAFPGVGFPPLRSKLKRALPLQPHIHSLELGSCYPEECLEG
jgi:hypothetical protein